MQHDLRHQPHRGWKPVCVPPDWPHIYPGGVTASLQPLHHLQGVSGLRNQGRKSHLLPTPTAPSSRWSGLCVGQKAAKEARKEITWLRKD